MTAKKTGPGKRASVSAAAEGAVVAAGASASALPGELLEGLAQKDGRLLEHCRNYWQMAEWERLCDLADVDLAEHPDRAKVAAMVAAGLAQTGKMDAARDQQLQARTWGCSPLLLAQLLTGGAYNSLARAASLCEEQTLSRRLFEASVACVMPQSDPKVLGRARDIQEKMRLGQLSGASEVIEETLRDAPVGAELARLGAQLAQVQQTLEQLTPAPLSVPAILREVGRGKDREPDLPILVCGHHKAGTNFLLPVFRSMAETFSRRLWLKFYDPEPLGWQICLHQHARMEDLEGLETFRGLHMVRHPMGLLHSATLYHERGREPWLNVPMDRFTGQTFWALSSRDSYNIIKDPEASPEAKAAQLKAVPPAHARVHDFDSGYDFAGRTYAEMLRSFDSLEEKIRFEMRCYSQGIIRDMLSFPADRRFIRVRLEDVTHDQTMAAMQAAVRHLGFGGKPARRVLEIVVKNSQWNKGKGRHATTGVSEEWQALFEGDLLAEFRRLFGWAEEALGYELAAL